jgi:rare lipoprotein A (peptidoglycan hydrolase)
MSPAKGGGLRAQHTGGRRLLVGSLLSLGLLVVPLLVLGTGATLTSATPGGAGGGRTAANASARPETGAIGSLKLAFQVPAASTTTAPPPTTTTTTAPPPTTTTTRPPPTTTTTTARPAAFGARPQGSTGSTSGLATWYAEAPPGKCANPWLPFGTTLTITDIATGGTITCVVDDREAAGPPHAVDLSPSGFEGMAPLSQGVIQVDISW